MRWRAPAAWTDDELHLTLALALTFGTGAVDAVSYFTLDHVFTANMSGNIALLGIGVATGVANALANACAFAGFVVGSIAAGRFMRVWRQPALRRVTEALALELALLLALTLAMGLVNVAADRLWRFAVCGALAAAMGLQTGVARHLAAADLNTTVVTMTLHDLAAASRLAGGDSLRAHRRAIAVAALLLGAALGVALSRIVRWGGLAVTSAVVAAVIATAVAGLRCPARR